MCRLLIEDNSTIALCLLQNHLYILGDIILHNNKIDYNLTIDYYSIIDFYIIAISISQKNPSLLLAWITLLPYILLQHSCLYEST